MKISMKNFTILCMFIIITMITFFLGYELLKIIFSGGTSIAAIYTEALAFIALTFILLIYVSIIEIFFKLATNQI